MRQGIPSPLNTPALNEMRREALKVRMMADLMKAHDGLLEILEKHEGLISEARAASVSADEKLEEFREVSDQMQSAANVLDSYAESVTRELARIEDIAVNKPGQLPSDEHIVALITPLIPEPIRGKDGEVPTKEELISLVKPLIPQEDSILVNVLKRIRQPKDGDTPVIDYTKLIETVISKLVKGKKLKVEHIAGLREEVDSYRHQMAMKQAGQHGGGDTIVQGSNITITSLPNGTKRISAPAPGASNPLTPTGSVDGSNTVFGVLSQPSSVVADGATFFEGFGYSYAAGNVTMDNPPTQYIRYYA